MEKNKIEYKVEFRKRKSIGIIINENGQVIVRAPLGVGEDTINQVIAKKERWIEEKLSMFKERPKLNEDEVMYLGKVCKVKVMEQKFLKKDFVYFEGDRFLVNVSQRSKFEKTLEIWFRERCLEKVLEYVKIHKDNFPVVPREIKVKEQKRKWGCCTYDNRIFFNWRLVMAREKAIQYVVVHEMCHMIQKNHSKAFWQEVEKVMPGYKIEDLYLKDKGCLMKIN